jgi:hypothetical protein
MSHIIEHHLESSFVGLKTCTFFTLFQTLITHISTTRHPTTYKSIPTDTPYIDASTDTQLSLLQPLTTQDISLQSSNKTHFLIFCLLLLLI